MIPVWGIGSHESFLLCVRVYICFLVHIIVLKKLNFLVTVYYCPFSVLYAAAFPSFCRLCVHLRR